MLTSSATAQDYATATHLLANVGFPGGMSRPIAVADLASRLACLRRTDAECAEDDGNRIRVPRLRERVRPC